MGAVGRPPGRQAWALPLWLGEEEWEEDDGGEEEEEEEEVLPPAPPHVCCGPHVQFVNRQRMNVNYKLFAAAADGCLECTRRLIEDGEVEYSATSDTYQYNALEYAEYARVSRNVNTWAVEEYLRDCGLEVRTTGPGR